MSVRPRLLSSIYHSLLCSEFPLLKFFTNLHILLRAIEYNVFQFFLGIKLQRRVYKLSSQALANGRAFLLSSSKPSQYTKGPLRKRTKPCPNKASCFSNALNILMYLNQYIFNLKNIFHFEL